MKKFLLIVTALFLSAVYANAEKLYKGFPYQGEISQSIRIGLQPCEVTRAPFRTVHGIRFNKNLFMGAGIGVDGFSSEEIETILPIFFNIKGYYPLSYKISLLAMLDLGGEVKIRGDKNACEFLIDPQVGFSLNMWNGCAWEFTFGFYHKSLSNNGLRVNPASLGFRIAYVW